MSTFWYLTSCFLAHESPIARLVRLAFNCCLEGPGFQSRGQLRICIFFSYSSFSLFVCSSRTHEQLKLVKENLLVWIQLKDTPFASNQFPRKRTLETLWRARAKSGEFIIFIHLYSFVAFSSFHFYSKYSWLFIQEAILLRESLFITQKEKNILWF